MEHSILLGAVAYDPKVVTIWEGIRDYFLEQGVAFDFALFSNYERQVEQLLAGHIDIAWNTPLAHVRVKERTNGQSIRPLARPRRSHSGDSRSLRRAQAFRFGSTSARALEQEERPHRPSTVAA